MGKFRIAGQIYDADSREDAYDQHDVALTKAPGIAGGMLQQFNQGFSLGGADELQAGIEAATGGRYKHSMQVQQRQRDLFQQQHPWLSAGATGVGAVAPVVASTLLAPETGGLSTVGAATRSAQMIGRAFRGQAFPMARTTGQAVSQGARYGAGFGAPAGAMSADPYAPGGRTLGAAAGAAGGAVLGGALPLVQGGYGYLSDRVSPYLSKALQGTGMMPTMPGSPMASRSASGPAPRATASAAEEKILRAWDEAGITPETATVALENARRRGVPLGIMDVGGQPMLRLARGTRTLPGSGSAQIDSFLQGRAEGQPGRVKSVLRRALGRGMDANPGGTSDDLLNQARGNSHPFYDQLNQHPVSDQQLLDTLNVPAARQILMQRDAQRAQWGAAGHQPLFDAEGNMIRKPTLADVNDVNVSINERRNPSYERNGGRPIDGVDFASREGNALAGSLQRDLLSRADAGPGGNIFATARANYAGPAQAKENFDQGLDFLKPNTDLQDVVGMMNGGPADRRWYTRGVAAALRKGIDSMPNLGQQPNVLRSFYNSPEQRSRLGAVVRPSQQGRTQAALEAENLAAQNSNFVRGGSQTADKLAEGADVALDIAQSAATGGSGLAAGTKALWNQVRGAFGENTRAEIARILTTVNPAEQRAIIARLSEINAQGKLRAEDVGRVVTAMTIKDETE
jgi:hypothetical protein